jgi:hypothetical protein
MLFRATGSLLFGTCNIMPGRFGPFMMHVGA